MAYDKPRAERGDSMTKVMDEGLVSLERRDALACTRGDGQGFAHFAIRVGVRGQFASPAGCIRAVTIQLAQSERDRLRSSTGSTANSLCFFVLDPDRQPSISVMASPHSTPYAAMDSLETGGKLEPSYQHISNPCVLSWNNLSYAVANRKTADAPEGK
ncbi:hypothetical protein PC128_g26955, partial [Phytophthora cactorum]